MTAAKHTPGSLSLGGPARCTLMAGDGEMLTASYRSPDERHANREHIVRTWNAHDGLLAACKMALDALRDSDDYAKRLLRLRGEDPDRVLTTDTEQRALRAIVAKARGEG